MDSNKSSNNQEVKCDGGVSASIYEDASSYLDMAYGLARSCEDGSVNLFAVVTGPAEDDTDNVHILRRISNNNLAKIVAALMKNDRMFAAVIFSAVSDYSMGLVMDESENNGETNEEEDDGE